MSICEEARWTIKDRDQKLQGDHGHVGDVEVVRDVREILRVEKKKRS